MLKLGLLCSHPLPAARPGMRLVMQYLDGDLPLPEFSPDYLAITHTSLVLETPPLGGYYHYKSIWRKVICLSLILSI